MIDCNIYSDGAVTVRSGRGAIVGGAIRASTSVSAKTVGSKAERQTDIVLGGLPYEEFERLQILKEMEQVRSQLEQIQAQPDGDQSKLPKLRLDLHVIEMKLNKFNTDMEKMQAQLALTSAEDACRLLCDTAYPGVVVTAGHQASRVGSVTQNCVIGLTEGLLGFLGSGGNGGST